MMIADQDILGLPKLGLNMKDLLPEFSGIYYVLDESYTVWYIGQAKNIRKRWQGKSHHRLYQLEAQKKYHFYIYYEAVTQSELNQVETQRIEKYEPHLNKSPVKTKQVRPTETLLRETIAAISDFAFIIGIEENPQVPEFIVAKKSLNNIFICIDEAALEEIYKIQSIDEKIAIFSNIFNSRKVYASKWEIVNRNLLFRLMVHGNYCIVGCWKNFPSEKDYIHTTLLQEPIRALTSESLLNIQQQMNTMQKLSPYILDTINPLFKDEIDRDSIKKKIEKISQDYKLGKRGIGSRVKSKSIEELILERGIDIQKYEGKARYYRGNKIGIHIQVFSFDFKEAPIIRDIIRGKDFEIVQPKNIDKVYLLTGVLKHDWLLFEDYFKGFAKLAVNLGEGEGYVEKIHVSPQKFIIHAKANIKISSLGYSAWIPFGLDPEFPTFETATKEIQRRLQQSDLPDLKISFKRESIS